MKKDLIILFAPDHLDPKTPSLHHLDVHLPLRQAFRQMLLQGMRFHVLLGLAICPMVLEDVSTKLDHKSGVYLQANIKPTYGASGI